MFKSISQLFMFIIFKQSSKKNLALKNNLLKISHLKNLKNTYLSNKKNSHFEAVISHIFHKIFSFLLHLYFEIMNFAIKNNIFHSQIAENTKCFL